MEYLEVRVPVEVDSWQELAKKALEAFLACQAIAEKYDGQFTVFRINNGELVLDFFRGRPFIRIVGTIV